MKSKLIQALTLIENEIMIELLKEPIKERTKENLTQSLKLITSAIDFIKLIKDW